MKRLFIIALSLFANTLTCHATFMADYSAAPEEAHALAKKLNLCTGLIMGESSDTGTCFLVNPTTAVTAGHINALEEKKKVAFFAAECTLAGNAQCFTVNDTIHEQKQFTLFKVKPLATFDPAEEPVEEFVKADNQIAKSMRKMIDKKLKLYRDPETLISNQLTERGNACYLMRGPDLAVLTLNKPVAHEQPVIPISTLSPEELIKYPAFVVGYSRGQYFNDGKKQLDIDVSKLDRTTMKLKARVVSLPPLKFCKATQCFYTVYSSVAGESESFIGSLKDEVAQQSAFPNLFGIIRGGMSGGPLIFKIGDHYEIAGVVSQTYHPQILSSIQLTLDSCDIIPREQKKLIDLLKEYSDIKFPTITTFQAFTPELLAALKESQKEMTQPEK